MPTWEEKNKWESHSEGTGIKIGRMDAAAGHKSAQKGEKPKILKFTTANAGL